MSLGPVPEWKVEVKMSSICLSLTGNGIGIKSSHVRRKTGSQRVNRIVRF